MENNNHISIKQYCAIIFISRIVVELLRTNEPYDLPIGTLRSLSMLLSLPMMMLLSLPLFILIKYSGGLGLIDVAHAVGKKFSIVIAIFYALFFSLEVIGIATRFELFVTQTQTVAISPSHLLLLLMISAVICAFMGIMAIGRVGGLFAVALIIVIALSCALLFGKMSSLNLYIDPHVNNMKIVTVAASEALQTSTIVVLMCVLSQVKLPKKINHAKQLISNKVDLLKSYKMIYGTLFFSVVVIVIIELSVQAVLGHYADLEQFAYYQSSNLIEISIFKRMGVLFALINMFAEQIKLTLYVFCIFHILKTVFNKLVSYIATCTAIVVCYFVTITLMGDNLHRNQFFAFVPTAIVVISFTMALPLIIILLSALKRRIYEKKSLS